MNEEEKTQLKLKEYYDRRIKECITTLYSPPNKRTLGYWVLVGGEALKNILGEKKVTTLDYDLKFAVDPKQGGINERTLKASNKIRVDASFKLTDCLNAYPPPKGYKIEFFLAIIQRINNQEYYDRVKFGGQTGYTAFLPERNKETGEILMDEKGKPKEMTYKYGPSKNFAIRMRYTTPKKEEGEFSIIDLGLRYGKPKFGKFYNYFERRLYPTIMDKQFKKVNPRLQSVPFVEKNKILYASGPFLLYDTYNLLLINMHLSDFTNSKEWKDFYEQKVIKSLDRLINLLDLLGKNKCVRDKDIKKSIEVSIRKFKKVNQKIITCFKSNFNTFTLEPKDIPECKSKEFINQLTEFETQYNYTMYLLSHVFDKSGEIEEFDDIVTYLGIYFSKKLGKEVKDRDVCLCLEQLNNKTDIKFEEIAKKVKENIENR